MDKRVRDVTSPDRQSDENEGAMDKRVRYVEPTAKSTETDSDENEGAMAKRLRNVEATAKSRVTER